MVLLYCSTSPYCFFLDLGAEVHFIAEPSATLPMLKNLPKRRKTLFLLDAMGKVLIMSVLFMRLLKAMKS